MQNRAGKLKQENCARLRGVGLKPARRTACRWFRHQSRLNWVKLSSGAGFFRRAGQVAMQQSRGKRMKIDIERFGLKEVPVDPETLFTFAEGLAGFENCKRFKIFHEEGLSSVFWLQSMDNADVMFPIVAPEVLELEYQIELSDADCALLGLESSDDAAVVIIVYRDDAASGKIAANTRSPLILNLKTRQGMQKILQEMHSTLLYRAR
jgi:flagellar assembly factor FliW